MLRILFTSTLLAISTISQSFAADMQRGHLTLYEYIYTRALAQGQAELGGEVLPFLYDAKAEICYDAVVAEVVNEEGSAFEVIVGRTFPSKSESGCSPPFNEGSMTKEMVIMFNEDGNVYRFMDKGIDGAEMLAGPEYQPDPSQTATYLRKRYVASLAKLFAYYAQLPVSTM
jgi:hypothetical protein